MRYLVGDERLHNFGVSYGTALGAVYAHLYPSHVGRLVLEASVDPTEDLNEEQVSEVKAVQAAFDRFAAHCAARIRHCPTGDGPQEVARRMARLADRLVKKPAPAGGGRNLDADDLAYAVSDHPDLGTDGWSPLAEALTALIDHNDGRPLSKGAEDIGSAGRAETPRDSSRAAQIAITCADSSLRPGFERLGRRGPHQTASPVFGVAWSIGVYRCHDWPFDGESATPQVNADGAAPVLVVGGTGARYPIPRRPPHGPCPGRRCRRAPDRRGRGPRHIPAEPLRHGDGRPVPAHGPPPRPRGRCAGAAWPEARTDPPGSRQHACLLAEALGVHHQAARSETAFGWVPARWSGQSGRTMHRRAAKSLRTASATAT